MDLIHVSSPEFASLNQLDHLWLSSSRASHLNLSREMTRPPQYPCSLLGNSAICFISCLLLPLLLFEIIHQTLQFLHPSWLSAHITKVDVPTKDTQAFQSSHMTLSGPNVEEVYKACTVTHKSVCCRFHTPCYQQCLDMNIFQ
jgi:hypothetical protein